MICRLFVNFKFKHTYSQISTYKSENRTIKHMLHLFTRRKNRTRLWHNVHTTFYRAIKCVYIILVKYFGFTHIDQTEIIKWFGRLFVWTSNLNTHNFKSQHTNLKTEKSKIIKYVPIFYARKKWYSSVK